MENKKIAKLVSELMNFCLKLGIKHIKSEVEKEAEMIKISIEGSTGCDSVDCNCAEKIERFGKSLNITREAQVDQYYWELAGEDNEYLAGMMIDKAEVSYKDNYLKIVAYRKK
ncbi:hypothetical protein [Fuchsiella alkaliacetigena]|uniref:hypothetical protein n=1 Tax=Fuchsiella alkaliacetigena TaxID=957042 RepID=UPI002009EA58|nr:hypothetical protein [Fuchsiella alkaliacetigena]MCK8825567.1 hypothetical protein [Fuchsiella alkaliacetigena]